MAFVDGANVVKGSSEKVWGSIHVNYKKLGDTCTFTPTSATTVTQYDTSDPTMGTQ